MLTLRIYAHAIREEEADLSFAEFGAGRHQTAPDDESVAPNEDAPAVTQRGRLGILERETGFEPAISTLARRKRPEK
jgi:hypothetical protein